MVKNGDLDKLISAALVSMNFREKLLTEPIAAVRDDYNRESFNIPSELVTHISTINAHSLSDLLRELDLQCILSGE